MKTDNRIIYQIIALALLFLAVSCEDSPELPGAESVNRTVLVYMVASNNLGSGGFDKADLQEMQKAAAAGDIVDGRLLVYHVPASGNPVLKEITSGGIDTLAEYGSEVSSVNSSRMREVFDDMRRLAPASDYGLVLWSHASGWLQDGMDDEIESIGATGDIVPQAFGQDKGRKMNMTALARTLEGEDFGFVYFDCCYMGAVEVAYELRKATPLVVASAAELPSPGMPYDLNVKCFFHPTPDLVGAARNTFEYYDSMSGSMRTCTMSVIKTSGMERLAAAVAAVYRQADSPWPQGYAPQRYMTESRCYHFDLAHYVGALTSDKALLDEFNGALADVVLYEDATPSLWNRLVIESHCGLTTYIFDKESQTAIKGYNTTSWYRDVASQLLVR